MPGQYHMAFNGKMLERGFWIYVWKVEDRGKSAVYYYVGRTGDSSSIHAASPFSRLSSHLARNPRANALLKHLHAIGIDEQQCAFDFFAFGPLFLEAVNWEDHTLRRDKTATVEKKVAKTLKARGFTVFGIHQVRPGRQEDSDEVKIMVNDIVKEVS